MYIWVDTNTEADTDTENSADTDSQIVRYFTNITSISYLFQFR